MNKLLINLFIAIGFLPQLSLSSSPTCDNFNLPDTLIKVKGKYEVKCYYTKTNLDSLIFIDYNNKNLTKSYFHDGYIDGYESTYSLSGQIIEKVLFKNGKEIVNTRMCFDTVGIILSNWQIDSLKGKNIFTSKYPNGNPAFYIEFNDSIKDGHSIYYDTIGNKVYDYLYNNGKINVSYSQLIDSAREFNKTELYTQLTHLKLKLFNVYSKYFGPTFEVQGSITLQMVFSRNKINVFLIYSDIDCIQFVSEIISEIKKN